MQSLLRPLMYGCLATYCMADHQQLRGLAQQSCSAAGNDRWGPDRGGCCDGLKECRETRPADNSRYCDPSDPQHGSSCWSYFVMCRAECTPQCSTVGTDRWGPDHGGCCTGLQECEEPRSADDPYYCDPANPQHRSTCWSYISTCRTECTRPPASIRNEVEVCAPFDRWPKVDNGVTCGNCTALVETSSFGGRCDTYCRSFGQVCVAAAEEVDENCEVKYASSCTTEIRDTTDMLCTCRAPTDADEICAPLDQWPNVDGGVTCGSCTALVETAPFGGKCDTYCRSFGQVCVAAAEEADENCEVKYDSACTVEIQDTSDMLCTCRDPTEEDGLYTFVGRGVAGSSELWNIGNTQGSGVLACYQAVMADSRCTKDYFTYVARGDSNCGCKGSSGALSVRDDGNADYYRVEGFTPTPVTTGGTLTAMSYNTEYVGYNSRIHAYGKKISDVGPGVVGIQECQDWGALTRASGYLAVPGIGNRNPILYQPGKVSLVDGSGGYMRIPRDNYAQRYISFAKFWLGGVGFWFFNTHLPHNHNEASSRNTHARIAQMLLQKRRELGAEGMPTVVTGDMNPFASNGASEGSFESNLVAAGFEKSYQARGNPGYRGLDKIFASRAHWQSSNGADRGTGSSDHPAIAVDLSLVR